MEIITFTNAFLKRNSDWSQVRLAKEIGVHPTTLNRFLHRKMRTKTTGERLAEFLLQQTVGEKQEEADEMKAMSVFLFVLRYGSAEQRAQLLKLCGGDA